MPEPALEPARGAVARAHRQSRTRLWHFAASGTTLLTLWFAGTDCGRRAPRSESAPVSSQSPSLAQLERLPCGTLSHAYTDGAAIGDAAYGGRRFTMLCSVVSVSADAGVPRLVLGSQLEPVVAFGVDAGAAASLLPGASIEIDCTITGSIADIPNLDCGPNGVPRPASAAP